MFYLYHALFSNWILLCMQVMVEGVCSDSFGMGESNRRSQDQNFLRGVFPDRASQSTSRSSRSTMNGHHSLAEITMMSTLNHGKLGKSQSNGSSTWQPGKSQSNGSSTWQPSSLAQYPYYPQRINFVPPQIATIV